MSGIILCDMYSVHVLVNLHGFMLNIVCTVLSDIFFYQNILEG